MLTHHSGTIIILHRDGGIIMPGLTQAQIIPLVHSLGYSLAYKDYRCFPARECRLRGRRRTSCACRVGVPRPRPSPPLPTLSPTNNPTVICAWVCFGLILANLILVILTGLHYRKLERQGVLEGDGTDRVVTEKPQNGHHLEH